MNDEDFVMVPDDVQVLDDRVLFCLATRSLPESCQVKIWNIVNESPTKTVSPRLTKFMERWAARGRAGH